MTEPHDYVTPLMGQSKNPDSLYYETHGLTKREYFAALAMQGLVAAVRDGDDYTTRAAFAVRQADLLIEALNQ